MEDTKYRGKKLDGQRSVFAFVDKGFPTRHSFVDGMLVSEYPRSTGVNMYVFVERTPGYPKVFRNDQAVILNLLPPRSPRYFIIRYFLIIRTVLSIMKRSRFSDHKVAAFVRNDPIALLAVKRIRFKFDRLIFQSSFPHEAPEVDSMKAKIARQLFVKGLKHASAGLGVSKLGAQRLQRYNPELPVSHIPLAFNTLDNWEIKSSEASRVKATGRPTPLTFLYVGTHSPARRLEVVFEAFRKLAIGENQFRLISIGASDSELAALNQLEDVKVLQNCGVLELLGWVPRERVWEYFDIADIGLSLIPPTAIFKESSPTKLAEYLGRGLVALASKGVPEQERLLNASGGGILVEFSAEAIFQGAQSLIAMKPSIRLGLVQSGKRYILENYKYSNYVAEFNQVLWEL